MGVIIDRMEKSGLAQGAQVIMKKMRGQNLTPEEESILHTANPLRFLQNNANRLRNRHMHWLADWTKPREGAGFHEKRNKLLSRESSAHFEWHPVRHRRDPAYKMEGYSPIKAVE